MQALQEIIKWKKWSSSCPPAPSSASPPPPTPPQFHSLEVNRQPLVKLIILLTVIWPTSGKHFEKQQKTFCNFDLSDCNILLL